MTRTKKKINSTKKIKMTKKTQNLNNVPVSDQSIASGSAERPSKKLNNSDKPVPPLNIQLLDKSKLDIYIQSNQDQPKKSVFEYAEEFINTFNKNVKKTDDEYVGAKSRKIDGCRQTTYHRKKFIIADMDYSEDASPDPTHISNYILFFFPQNDDKTFENILAGTTGRAWQSIRPLADFNFPISIIDKIGLPEKIAKVQRRQLFAKSTTEILLWPRQEELHKTPSLFYRVEQLLCYVDMSKEWGVKLFELLKNAIDASGEDWNTSSFIRSHQTLDDSENEDEESSHELKQSAESSNGQIQCSSPAKKKRKTQDIGTDKNNFRIFITTAGSVKISKQITVNAYIPIINLFNKCFLDSSPIIKKFDFLHFFKIAKELASKLDDELIKEIFQSFRRGQKLYVNINHTYQEDFLLNSSLFEIEIRGNKEFLSSEAPHIDKIIDVIDSTNEDIFKDSIKNGKILFYYKNEEKSEPIIDYLEGELFYNNENYFKIGKIWYQTDADYLSLLQQDFEKVMDDLFIERGDEGSLPLPWTKYIPLDQKELERHLSYSPVEIEILMQKLKNTNISYISEGYVKQKILVGEILNNTVITKFKKEIEYVLDLIKSPIFIMQWDLDLGKKIKANHKIRSDKKLRKYLKTIWKELNEKRPVLKEHMSERNLIFVSNPFIYPLEQEPKYEELTEFLTNTCNRNKTEGVYNLSYENLDGSNGVEYLVFDQITPDGIEPCDIFGYSDSKLYLYHVKEKIGEDTRIVCSQILNAARNIHEALRTTNQTDNYLKNLWNMSIKLLKEDKKSYKMRQTLKRKLETITEKKFIDMFRNKDIVFVYAYRTPTGFQKSYQRANIDPNIESACIKKKFLNENGFLTSTFIHSSLEEFSSELYREDPTITKSERKNAYNILKKRLFSSSTIAKMEIVRLEEQLRTFPNRFKLKICEIPSE